MSDIAIRVDNLSKQYKIGEARNRHDTFKDLLTHGLNNLFRPISQHSISNSQSDTIWALKDIYLDVKQGETLGIIGRNGAGKSTLLKILSRITEPTSGRVEIYGRVGSLLEVGIGFDRELTGRENIYLNGAILGMKKAEIDRKFDDIVDFSGIGKFIDTPVKRYSTGMHVRLAFAVAAHLEPEILIVDEVLAVGDAEFQKKCLARMEGVAKEGRTVLFVSHNMGAVQSLCGRIILLNDGGIAGSGLPDEVISQYLSAGMERSGEVTWPEEEAPGSEEMRLRNVRLLDIHGGARSCFRTDEQILVEIRYDLRQRVRGMRINLHMYTESGVLAFMSSNHALSQATESPGTYVTKCTIPANLMNIGRYTINLAADIPGVQLLCPGFDCMSLDVDGPSLQGTIYPDKYRGVVSPKLHWWVDFIEGCQEP